MPDSKVLFLGDYVDRGEYGPEVVSYLLSLKVKFPNEVFMLRGNHECREMTSSYNFREQCVSMFDVEVYDAFMDLFDCLPLACVVNGSYLCMHGGISSQMKSLESINQIDRQREPSEEGLMTDLLWADPASTKKCSKDFKFNNDRKISVIFGKNPTNRILESENLLSIIRAHQVQRKGYKFHKWNGPELFPPIITVFSAPNYGCRDN